MLILLGTWAVLVTAIITVGWLLDNGMDANPAAKRQLAQYLAVAIRRDRREWLRDTHRIFLDAFDRVYGGSWAWPLEQAVWMGLFASPGLMLAAALGDRAREDGGEATGGLVAALFGLGLFVMVMFLVFTLARRGTSGRANPAWSVRDFVSIVFGIGIGILFSIVAGIASGIVDRIVGVIGSGIVVGIVFGIGAGIVSGSIKIPINPLKALVSSLFFFGIVSLVQREAGWDFVHAVQADITVLAFVSFNVLADGISLLETRWVLRRAASVGVGGLLGLVAVDLVASAAIFLAVPTILWPQVLDFWDAWLFQGDQPWLGILFWTTFSTSALFYFFVAAAVVARPLRGLALSFERMSRLFDLDQHPVRCISVALAVVVTVVFIGVGIAQGISNGAEASLPPVSPGTAWLVPA